MLKEIFIIVVFFLIGLFRPGTAYARTTYWPVQSIDTMKFSRDLAREKLNDKSFESVINEQAKNIAATGATHVAIGTPYDSEFIPFIHKWVRASRANNLNVWFRGNFSGWEGWFGYAKITRDEHLRKTQGFILENPELFADGDILTACTECENGGPGDPRSTGDVPGFRQFLIEEYEEAAGAFEKIGKKVDANYFSMNADVARLVMDKATTQELDGVVVIDHYTLSPEKLVLDIQQIADLSGGKVIVGETGVPIPDIHGSLSKREQAEWLDSALELLSQEPAVAGMNYWVANGGTTALWDIDGVKRSAVDVITSYFSPETVSGRVFNELGRPVKNAEVIGYSKTAISDKDGNFSLIKAPALIKIIIKADSYDEKTIDIKKGSDLEIIVLKKTHESIFFKIQKFFYNFLQNLH